MNIVELNTTLVEDNIAYQEDIATEEEREEVAPLIKSLRNILKPFDESKIVEEDKTLNPLFVDKQEENCNDNIAPSIKALRAILKPYVKDFVVDDISVLTPEQFLSMYRTN